jgi:hypothetical protein
MTAGQKQGPARGAGGSRDLWILVGMAALSLAPYAANHGMFDRLFWFGDEFDLMEKMDRLGFCQSLWLAFSENFVPLFKALWGGAIVVFGGSYAAMITLSWLTHALNVFLLGRLMRTCGLSWVAVLFAQVVFGLTPANLETLAWSVQWSAILSLTFMLLGLDSFFRKPSLGAPVGWAAASALSFSRGVLTGLLLAAASLWPAGKAPLSKRLGYAAAYVLPSIAVGLLITVMVPTGNHRHMAGHWGDAAGFGAWYYCLNPAYRLLGVESWGPRTVVLLGLLKCSLAVWAIARSRGSQRLLFLLLVAFDLGNAALLGIGRYQTGLSMATSSRYQYASLVGIIPLAGFWLSRQWERLPGPAALRGLALTALLAGIAVPMLRQWPVDLDPFTAWRGTESRRVLLGDSSQEPQVVPGYPDFPMERARQLIVIYNLH